MATLAASHGLAGSTSVSGSYERFAGVCGVLTGVVGFLYAVAFVVLRSPSLSALWLLLGGLWGTATLVGVYGRLRDTDASFARLALLLGVSGALGAAIH